VLFKYLNDISGIDKKIFETVLDASEKVKTEFLDIEDLAEYHQAKILFIMKELQVSTRHFTPTTGYGYGDEGRDMLDSVFAYIFGGEDALVRASWASATHAINDCMFALLRPGEKLLSITGKPYDTLEKTIGQSAQNSDGSLKDWGIDYCEVDLDPFGEFDMDKVLSSLKDETIKLVLIQRSGGYTRRPSITIEKMRMAIDAIKSVRRDVKVLVDNCYGEFTEKEEPCHAGADISVGSLIKNPGGGLAPTGAYAAGTSKSIEQLSYRLTTPGLGKEIGSYAASYSPFYQGVFLAPNIVSQALKGAVLSASLFETLGYKVFPKASDKRSDIIQSIEFNCSDELIRFCQAIQSASPVDAHVTPIPWDMPGYKHQVIMAAGTFIQGASIELSADAPIREPYIAFMQGGLTFAHVKIALMQVMQSLKKSGYLSL